MGGTLVPYLFGCEARGVVDFPHRRIESGVKEGKASGGKYHREEDVLQA